MRRAHLRDVLLVVALAAVANPAVAQKVPSTPFDSQLERVKQFIVAGRVAQARSTLHDLQKRPGQTANQTDAVVYFQAMLECCEGNFDTAATRIAEHIPLAKKRPADSAEFYFHNNLLMIRQAQGDLMGAIVELGEMKQAGQRGSWVTTSPAVHTRNVRVASNDPIYERNFDRVRNAQRDLAQALGESAPAGPSGVFPVSPAKGLERPTQVQLKDLWHRAYLLRMLATALTGERRATTLRYAEDARRAYATLAGPLGPFNDSIAVLDAFFAVHDGNKKGALAAARRVDAASNDDVEDLYLVQLGLQFGGDPSAAEAVRAKIKSAPFASHAVPIMLRFMERDTRAKTAQQPVTKDSFSPLHPGVVGR